MWINNNKKNYTNLCVYLIWINVNTKIQAIDIGICET